MLLDYGKLTFCHFKGTCRLIKFFCSIHLSWSRNALRDEPDKDLSELPRGFVGITFNGIVGAT